MRAAPLATGARASARTDVLVHGARTLSRLDLGRTLRWYRRVDLNHRPLVPQTSALTN